LGIYGLFCLFSDGARQPAHDHEVNLFVLHLQRWLDFSDDEHF